MVRQGHLIAVVKTFLIGCAVALVVVGCAGAGSGTSQGEQERTEATKKEQARSPEAASEEARCRETQPVNLQGRTYTTNDVPGCPKGGLLTGTDGRDKLDGEDGDDEIRGLGAEDWIWGGLGSDVIYGGAGNDFMEGSSYWSESGESIKDVLHGGPGDDSLGGGGGDDVLYGGDGNDAMLYGGKGEDIIYGGDGNDLIEGTEVDPGGVRFKKQRDELYCGGGKDRYVADELDYVDSSCEVKDPPSNL